MMFNFTVLVPGGGVVPFNGVDPTDTVKSLKAAIGEKVDMATFNLYAKNLTTDSRESLLKRDVDGTSLFEAGLRDGGVLRVAKPSKAWTNAKHAEWRVSRGLTRVATSLNAGFTEVGGKVEAVGHKADEILGILCGKPAPKPEGQSDKEYLKGQRLVRDVASANIREVREREEKRIADEKKGRAAGIIKAAEMADGGVDLVAGALEGADLKDKWATHQAQGVVLQAARRKEKRSAKAQGKAAAKPKAGRGKKRGPDCLLPASPTDQDQKEAPDIKAEVDELMNDETAKRILGDEAAAASSSSSDTARAQ